jgi:uncharacterized protein
VCAACVAWRKSLPGNFGLLQQYLHLRSFRCAVEFWTQSEQSGDGARVFEMSPIWGADWQVGACRRPNLELPLPWAPPTGEVAAAGIAAHEAGHALQDAVDYFPLEARTYIVPVVQLASQTAPWLFIAGVMLQLPTLAWVGVILFGTSSVFALITLPVEFNASARAQELLISHGIIRGDEQIAGVQKVLGAAAWTYVAAAVSAIGSWLFYVFVLLSQARSAGFRR